MLMAKLGWTDHLQAVIVPVLVSAFGVFFMRQYLVTGACPTSCSRPAGSTAARTLRTCTGTSCCRPPGRPRRCSACSRSWQTWNDFFWPLRRADPGEPDRAGRAVHAGQRLRTPTTRSCSTGTALATLPLLLVFVAVRPADHRRHHGRSGQGMTDRSPAQATADGWSGSRPASSGAPPPPRTRSRARPPRTAAAPSIWDTFAHTPGRVRRRRHRRRRLRPLPPLPRRRRADGRARAVGAYRFSVVLAAGAARRLAARSTGAGSTSTTGWSTSCCEPGIEPVAHALPLGPAAGAGGRAAAGRTRDTAVPVRRLRRAGARARSATGSRTGPRSTSRGARRSSATARACTRRAGTDPAAALARRPPPAARRTAWPLQALRASCRAREVALDAQPRRGRGRSATRRRDRRRGPARSTALQNRLFLDPVLRGALPGRRARRHRRRSPTWPSSRPATWR